MAHEPKLSAYIIKLKTIGRGVEKTNRFLFKSIIENKTAGLEDSYIFLEICRKFIEKIDTEQMYSDEVNKKSMTANQLDIEDSEVNPNITFHSNQFIIEGIVEGGKYGKRRKKTSTANKRKKDDVTEDDAITDDFYFLIYTPLESDKSILLIQSYTDDNIDSVMKKFWKDFLTFPNTFKGPSFTKFIPHDIINDFKDGATISTLTYTTEIASSTLLGPTINVQNKNFKVTVKIEPTNEGLTYSEYDEAIGPIAKSTFKDLALGIFNRKKGSLRDNQTGKSSQFELGNDFEIKPSILLSKYITINNDESDFEKIKAYCFETLESIKKEVYPQNEVQER